LLAKPDPVGRDLVAHPGQGATPHQLAHDEQRRHAPPLC
jgi:hypothetical protein